MSLSSAVANNDFSGTMPERQMAAFPLALAAPGERVRIVALTGGSGMAKRLDAMGLHPGCEFDVLQTEGASGMLIRMASTRLAVGTGMLHRIRVCKL